MQQLADNWVTILTLVIALVAAIGGPFVALQVGRRLSKDTEASGKLQAETQLAIARTQVVAPMRQAWIDKLRDLVADILGKSESYRLTDAHLRSEDEKKSIITLENRLSLLINPNEADHSTLVSEIRRMMSHVDDELGNGNFWLAKNVVVELTQKILKAEWDRTKGGI